MSLRVQIFFIIFSLLFIIYVYSKIKKKHLSIEYSLMWFGFAILMLMASISPEFLRIISNFIGIKEVSNMVFFFGFILLIFIVLNLTSLISKQNAKISNLVQEIAILKKEMKDKNEKHRQ